MVQDTVFRIVAETANVSVDVLHRDMALAELGIDSLQGLNLICELENAFNVNFTNAAALNVRSLGDMVDGIEAMLRAPKLMGT